MATNTTNLTDFGVSDEQDDEPDCACQTAHGDLACFEHYGVAE